MLEALGRDREHAVGPQLPASTRDSSVTWGSGSTLLKLFCFGSRVGFACCFGETQSSRVRLISDEDLLWNHSVNSLRPVDDLSDMIVHRHAGDHVRFVARNLREAFRYEDD